LDKIFRHLAQEHQLPKEEINLILNAKIPTLQTTMRHNYSDQLSQANFIPHHPTLVLQRSLPQLHGRPTIRSAHKVISKPQFNSYPSKRNVSRIHPRNTQNQLAQKEQKLKNYNSIPTPRNAMSQDSTLETPQNQLAQKEQQPRNENPPRANHTLTAPHTLHQASQSQTIIRRSSLTLSARCPDNDNHKHSQCKIQTFKVRSHH
jgi:hypothetical protein